MDDAGFIIGSYVLTFSVVGFMAWRVLRLGRRVAMFKTSETTHNEIVGAITGSGLVGNGAQAESGGTP